jgi:hypothetical protein
MSAGAGSLDEVIGARTAVLVPDAVGDTAVHGHWQLGRYTLVDRGSYDIAHDVTEPALFELAVREATRITQRALYVVESRVLVLGAGDYLLAHHDRVHDGFPIEVMIDLSPAVVQGAEVHYRRRGQVFFQVPSAPGALSIVERGPSVTCNHTYISRRHLDARVVRLVLLLRD